VGKKLGKDVPEASELPASSATEFRVVPKAGMAVLHFPCTVEEYCCLKDPLADHEGEEAVSPKYICQQFLWSTPYGEGARRLTASAASKHVDV
jgi:hypothetical protein